MFTWVEQSEKEIESVFSLFKDRYREYTEEEIDELYNFYTDPDNSVGLGVRYQCEDGTAAYKGFNKLEKFFFFYCLYKRLGNEEKAVPFISMARNYYVRQYVSAYWERAVYRTFKAMYGMTRAVPDCVLPNGKRPDLVIDPELDEQNKFDLSGVRILRGKVIVDAKTSLYDISKEKRFYWEYCDQLVIATLEPPSSRREDEKIQVITSEDLLVLLNTESVFEADPALKNALIDQVLECQYLYELETWESEFNERWDL